jgi:hypothetical protein
MEALHMEDYPGGTDNQQNPQDKETINVGNAGGPSAPAETSQDAKNLAMLCHLLGLLTSFLGPLILWLIKKDEQPFVDEQGKEALNFQITVMLAYIVGGITSVICVGFILLAAAGIADLVFSIMACIAASKGEHYRYPVTLRLLK